jgi:hypothetical protein
MSAPDRRGMLDCAAATLSIRRQCALLGIARSGVYRPKRPANDNDLGLMRRIDELFTAWPFLGSRRMAAMLKAGAFGTPSMRLRSPSIASGERDAKRPALCVNAPFSSGHPEPAFHRQLRPTPTGRN